MTRTKVAVVVATAMCLAVVPFALAGGGGNKSNDAIWINTPNASASASSPTLSYGQSFTAGFTSRSAYPWAHAQCFDSAGAAFWGEWRALQADGTIGVFDLTTNTGQSWPGVAVNCALDLVSLQPKFSVLATTSFSVAAS